MKISVLFLIVLLCVPLCMTLPCKADTLWSDDFNDGNYDGWTVLNGTFTIEDGKLKAGSGDRNIIVYSSYNTYGTWSFDLLFNPLTSVTFIGTYPIVNGAPQQGFILGTSSTGGYSTLRKYLNHVSGASNPPGFFHSNSTWHHIDITRNLEGRICAYDNGTLVIDFVDTSAIPTSEYFAFYSAKGAIIDNIVVSDTVDIEPPAVPFYMQPWFIPSIAAVALVVIATVILLLRKK